jgi:hypothetical protein
MKKLFIIIIIFISFQSWTKADDIRDFQIEGMSIGDNLLDYFTKEELDSFNQSFGSGHNGIEISSDDKSRYNYYPLTTFQGFQVSYKINNNTFFEITGMAGAIWFKDDIKGCLKRKEKIKSTIKDSLGTSVINIDDQNIKRKHWADKSGKSFTYDTTYYLKNEDHISLDCFDWSKETDYWDHLRLTVSTSEHNDLVNNDYNK